MLSGWFWGTSILSSRNSPCKGPEAVLGSRSWTAFLGFPCLASSALDGYPDSILVARTGHSKSPLQQSWPLASPCLCGLSRERCREGLPGRGISGGRGACPLGTEKQHQPLTRPLVPGSPGFQLPAPRATFHFGPAPTVGGLSGPCQNETRGRAGLVGRALSHYCGHQIVLGGGEDPGLLHRPRWTCGGISSQPGPLSLSACQVGCGISHPMGWMEHQPPFPNPYHIQK